jgi:hypothetical protein
MPDGKVPKEHMPDGEESPAQKDDGSLPEGISLNGTTEITSEITREKEELKIKYISALRLCAPAHWPKDLRQWWAIEKVLSAAAFERVNGTLRISGLGMQAGMYQDRYARTFERDLIGLGETVTIEFTE